MTHAPRWIPLCLSAVLGLVLAAVVVAPARAQLAEVLDLATLSADDGDFLRAYGSAGERRGIRGVPVAGGHDTNEDGAADYAFAAFLASPDAGAEAGEVYLIFGDGGAAGSIDTALSDDRILVITGAAASEHTGSEIWMDDVTGDGIGDLLIARQDFSLTDRVGAGALSIVVGGSELADLAATGEPLDLGDVPESVTVTTFVGPTQCGRLGMWVRTGDVTGDGVPDVLVGADQQGSVHRGAAYLVRGGSDLAGAGVVDLADFGTTALEGDIARIAPAAVDGNHSHFGATVQIGDLDGNGKGEVLIGVTLNRSGGGSRPAGSTCSGNHGRSDQTRDGTLVIAWDDNFTGDPWAAGFTFTMDAAPGTTTRITGNDAAVSFGEEIIAGYDFDANDAPDLFVGDIVGDQSGEARTNSGSGYVFWDAAVLAGLSFDMQAGLPMGVEVSVIQGASSGDIASDTAAAGDFDGDGIDDLAVASPCADPNGRSGAGFWDILRGSALRWPAYVDLASPPAPEALAIVRVWGAEGTGDPLDGDTLGYSAAAGFIDGDARMDLISNEMRGDGVAAGQADVGNLIVLPGTLFVPEPSAGPIAAFALTVVAALRRRQAARTRLH